MNPKVTFIVPCYNLAHLLPECIHSILSQTFGNFEVLIMDDCSPDATPQVAQSFGDPRVKHIRNEKNLRHLANYNKGIGMARGKYIWLISADDSLRKPYVLERYVALMDVHPKVGFVFCPAMALHSGGKTEIAQWSFLDQPDGVIDGRKFLMRLLQSNCISAPSGMVRRDCYGLEQFPLDLPYAGDWYLWALFSFYYDVAYLSEPMVNYRLHDESYTSFFLKDNIQNPILSDEINVRWRIMRRVEAADSKVIARKCMAYIANDYATRIQMKEESSHRQGISLDDFNQSLKAHVKNATEERWIRSRVFSALADFSYSKKQYQKALCLYKNALREDKKLLKARIKSVLITMGRTGIAMRKAASIITHNAVKY